MLTFTLPYPPSVNTYWGFSGHRRFLTKKAKEFKDIVQQTILLIPNRDEYKTAKLNIFITLNPPDRKKRDIDNVLKPLLDAMTGLYNDDSQIVFLSVLKDEPIKGGKSLIIINIKN